MRYTCNSEAIRDNCGMRELQGREREAGRGERERASTPQEESKQRSLCVQNTLPKLPVKHSLSSCAGQGLGESPRERFSTFNKTHNLTCKGRSPTHKQMKAKLLWLGREWGRGRAGAGLPPRLGVKTRVTDAAGQAKPCGSGRPALFVPACSPPPWPQGSAQASLFSSQAGGGSVHNRRTQSAARASCPQRRGPRATRQPRLPIPSEQTVNCFCFPRQWLLCRPCRGAAGDRRHHSLPWLLSLAFDLGQRTLKPLQLLGLAHFAPVCGHGAGYHRRRQLCGSSVTAATPSCWPGAKEKKAKGVGFS